MAGRDRRPHEHFGTAQRLALADEAPETYRTLQNNLEKASFRQQEPSFRWARQVDGLTVLIEFLCETDQLQPGRIFKPKGEYTGTKLGAFDVAAPGSPGTTTSNARSAASVSITAGNPP